jgi:hypothetical protein
MRKNNTIRIVLTCCILSVAIACNEAVAVIGKGNIKSETRDVSSFTCIELLSSANVEIKKGATFQVVVSDHENLLPYIQLCTDNNTLYISTLDNKTLINSKTKISITMPDPLYRISLKGSGNFYLDAPFNDLHALSIAGSGDIYGEVPMNLGKLELNIMGSGNIEMRGIAEEVKARIAGSGDIRLTELTTRRAECSILGSGDIEITVRDYLKARINGSGDLRYAGNPATDVNINGSGSIERL